MEASRKRSAQYGEEESSAEDGRKLHKVEEEGMAATTEEKAAPPVEAAASNKGAQDRNRRMFGSLMSHLGKAKQAIVKDSKIIEKQHTIVETASKRNTLDGKIKAIEGEVTEIKTKKDKWVGDLEAISHLMLTISTPQITWLPAKHNEVTRALLEREKEKRSRATVQRLKGDDAKVAELLAKKRVIVVKKPQKMTHVK